MWSAISKIFTKNSSNTSVQTFEDIPCEMDRAERRKTDMDETFVARLAKQRASMKWLLAKAFNNKVPENLKEPFYRDHENQEHLKPQIAGGLANAEIYCLALGNIYSDPNYHNLNHSAILQTLARKGVFELTNGQLTETTLIQTNPLRTAAHMAVIEMIMHLYTREVLTPDRILAAVQRFSHDRKYESAVPENHDQCLLLWIAHACSALKQRIEQESRNGISNGESDRCRIPEISPPKELKDLCDGVGLAALISYYCPDELHWKEIRISNVPSVQDSLYNLRLVEDFCNRCLPASIFHLVPEDVTYMRDSMKQNLIALLADLFNVMEINPAKCVRYPGMDKYTNAIRSTPTHTALRKTNSLQQSISDMTEDSLRKSLEDSFVVHRGKNIPTLRSVVNEEQLVPARLKVSKEKHNNDSKADERGEVAAGRPSNWEENKKPTFAGRRSRRNSTSDDSQLTIENFGGSQDNLNFIGRNPDKEVAVHVGRKISEPSFPVAVENAPVRSTYQDARCSFQLGYDDSSRDEKQDNGTEKLKLKRQLSSDDISFRNLNKENVIKDLVDGEVRKRMSFADLGRQKDVREDISKIEKKWGGDSQTCEETQHVRTPDLENMDLEQYQQSIAQMNSSLNDIQSDMRRLATQQNQLQAQQQQNLIAQQQRQIQALQQQYSKQAQIPQYPSPQPYQPPVYQPAQQVFASPLQSSTSAPHIPQSLYRQPPQQPQDRQFFLHDRSPQLQPPASASVVVGGVPQHNPITIPQRRTWSQQQQQPVPQLQQLPPIIPISAGETAYHHHQPELRTWAKTQQPEQDAGGGFILHDTDRFQPRYPDLQRHYSEESRYSDSPRYQDNPRYHQESSRSQQDSPRYHQDTTNNSGYMDNNSTKYQNGSDEQREQHTLQHSNSFTLSQQHLQQHQQYGTSHSTPSASPQHRNIHRQISQLLDESKRAPVSLQQIDTRELPQRKSSIIHAPIPAPPADDMEPQNISFIGNADKLSEGLSRLNITSGSRTYRIPSPTRPHIITRNSFQPSPQAAVLVEPTQPISEISSLDADPTNQKGFYISFDDEQPKRPKPPLRTKRMSPKKERSYVESPEETYERRTDMERKKQMEREFENEKIRKEEVESRKQAMIELEREKLRQKREASQERQKVNAASALVIGNDLSNPDPDLDYERERKKEKIMLLSLQRRQRQEEAKARKEAEAQARKEREKEKEEERARKKEEQAARRQAILEQYKMKKAIEEAEREGKTIDRSELSSLKPTPKMRPKASTRPRPKTIHIDSGSVQIAEGMSSRGKKGSATNLTAYTPNSMKRDYYRGSQDSLADRSMSSGMLYKDSPDDSRGVSPCHSANQTLGRRSSYKTSRGSSTDQDSIAYRFGDTDSGLGRATPPRRAPSPGVSGRHLPSPSGPGSLPGLLSRGRRMFDDGSSDISSTPSSMMDYNGPRLYKQPATKSNRSIMLNAVEYCVFPGVVNRDAKRRVLEEINKSESKHFLILFRDAGCQFRALYSYCPEREDILKLYGTGPKQVNDKMFDKFFKYNSGGKCFSQVHTKHLTVTIDAFTIHNSLWQGKKVNLPNKKDMALVI